MGLALRLPANKRLLEEGLAKARADVDAKFIKRGPGIVQHLALPAKGRSLNWIMAEMDKMDAEAGHTADWRAGRVSGAIYRAPVIFILSCARADGGQMGATTWRRCM